MQTQSDTKIIICGKCKGKGLEKHSKLVNFQDAYDRWTENCVLCKGSGRLLEKTTSTYEISPYKSEKPISRVESNQMG